MSTTHAQELTAMSAPADPGFDPAPPAAPSPRVAGAVMPAAHRCAPHWDGPVPRTGHTPANTMVWLLGASGGVGVSMLTASIAFAGDCDRAWPTRIGMGPGTDSPLVVIVARTTMSSLRAAHDLLLQHFAGGTAAGIRVVGILAVADTDRPLSRSITQYLELLESAAGRLWRLGWIEAWRVLTPDETPTWGPDSAVPPDKRSARDPARTPPEPVRELYDQLCRAAIDEAAQIYPR